MTPPIRTRPDGTKYPISGGGGGGGVRAVIAGGVALAVWASGGGAVPFGTSTGSSALSAAESAAVRNIKTNLSKAREDVRRGKPERAWQRLKLRKTPEKVRDAVECAVSSYGRVQEFFAHRPCKDLRRVQFTVSYDDGTMAVLVSRVRMYSTKDARRFRNLIDEYGTGDIRPVLPHVRFTGHHYDSRRDRSTVFVAEIEPVAGNVPEPILETTTEAAVVLARSAPG